MGLFSKKPSSGANSNQRPLNKTFVANDQIVTRIAELMMMFNNAVGNGNMVLAIAKDICSAAGLRDFEQILESNIRTEVWLEQPWKMLAAVALRAAQNGDHILVARIFGFTSYWETLIVPRLGRGDLLDVLLTKSPPAIEAEIATLAFRSLQQLPVGQVIFGNDVESVTAGHFTRAAAKVLVNAPEKGVLVDDVIMAAAKSFI